MRKFLQVLLVIGLLLVAFISNPSLTEHERVVIDAYNELINEEVDKLKLGEGLGQLGKSLGGFVAKEVIEQKVSRENLLICSLTKLNHKGEVHFIGIGIFGQVFLFQKPSLDQVKNG